MDFHRGGFAIRVILYGRAARCWHQGTLAEIKANEQVIEAYLGNRSEEQGQWWRQDQRPPIQD